MRASALALPFVIAQPVVPALSVKIGFRREGAQLVVTISDFDITVGCNVIAEDLVLEYFICFADGPMMGRKLYCGIVAKNGQHENGSAVVVFKNNRITMFKMKVLSSKYNCQFRIVIRPATSQLRVKYPTLLFVSLPFTSKTRSNLKKGIRNVNSDIMYSEFMTSSRLLDS